MEQLQQTLFQIASRLSTILDADDEWVKLIVHEKKSDSTMIVRLDNIDSITLD